MKKYDNRCRHLTKKLERNGYVYYSPEFKENLRIYHLNIEDREEYCIYDPVNVNETRELFMQKNSIENIDDNMSDKWHKFFFDVMNSTYSKRNKRKKNSYIIYTSSKLLRIECGDRAYMICRPKTTELLYDLIDGKVVFDIFRIGRYMIANNIRREWFYDKAQKMITKEKNENCVAVPPVIDVDMLVRSFGYESFDEFKKHEKNNICYALFLEKLRWAIIDGVQKWCMENHIKYLVNMGKGAVIFPYSGIGFLRERCIDRALYYCPFFNALLYDNNECFRSDDHDSYAASYSNEHWDSNDELIEVPVFASPETILTETGLSLTRTYDKDVMDYYLGDKIYYDNFWNEYGIRTKEEQLLIYSCICRYKRVAYNWFTDRGAKVYPDINRID